MVVQIVICGSGNQWYYSSSKEDACSHTGRQLRRSLELVSRLSVDSIAAALAPFTRQIALRAAALGFQACLHVKARAQGTVHAEICTML